MARGSFAVQVAVYYLFWHNAEHFINQVQSAMLVTGVKYLTFNGIRGVKLTHPVYLLQKGVMILQNSSINF